MVFDLGKQIMAKPEDVSQGIIDLSPELQGFDQERFQTSLKQIINTLGGWERDLKPEGEIEKEDSFYKLQREVILGFSDLTEPEQFLFNRLIDLFAIKHQVGAESTDRFERTFTNPIGKLIGFLGPLGVSKSTIARFLRKDLADDFPINEIREPHLENLFWRPSQKKAKYMLASQTFFLLANIMSDILAKGKEGLSISDTSTLTDILMWVDWYHKTNRFSDEDYQTYLQLVCLLKDIIPKPDLLVTLLPDSINNLKQGVINRAQAEGERIQEEALIEDLSIEVARVEHLVDQGGFEAAGWGDVRILKIIVNPLKIYEKYEDPTDLYDCISQIEAKLGLLGHLLDPKPEEVANEIMRILVASLERQVIVIHAKSMFTGKTTALCNLVNKVGEDRALVFQPEKGLRFEGQEAKIISNDKIEQKAITIWDNNLQSILNFINENEIDPKKHPYIFIDEVQLFIAHKGKSVDAVNIIKELWQMGFNVIVDGIDYSFQNLPFTFMFGLLEEVAKYPKNWHEIQMKTRCWYCDQEAEGTRRYKNKDGTREIADFHDVVFQPGSEEYQPVCCKAHSSCVGQSPGFVRKKLPTEI